MKTTLVASLILVLARCVSAPDKPVVSSMEDQRFLVKFVHANCGYEWKDHEKQTAAKKEACERKWRIALGERLHQKYPLADIGLISQRCKEWGERCTLEDLERFAQELQGSAEKGKK